MIEVRELTRRFGAVTAVDRVSFSVRTGLVGFLGPNGAGKTTTLRMLTGASSITSGTARVADFDVFEQPLEVKARVGYLPESPPLYPELTVGEYLGFAAEIHGIGRGSRLSRVGAVMERVGLAGAERRVIGTLSKGFRQRVALAQALVHDPPVLMLDEPTTGLDPTQIVGLRELIVELARERLVLWSTHALSEVEALCERVLVLHRGRLLGDGTVAELARRAGLAEWVELVLDAADADPSAALAALPEVRSVRALAPLRFRIEGDLEVEPALFGVAAARGWRVRALARRVPHLEDVFLALVGAA